MRERGLKLIFGITMVALHMSLPVRERGLKPSSTLVMALAVVSLPVRERGLKHNVRRGSGHENGRSPCGSVD